MTRYATPYGRGSDQIEVSSPLRDDPFSDPTTRQEYEHMSKMINERAIIGDNNPPEPISPFDALSAHINDLYELAEGSLIGKEIVEQSQADDIQQLKADLKNALSEAEKHRKLEKEPCLEAGREVDVKWKAITEKANLAVKTAYTALTPYLLKLEAEKKADQDRLRKQADEKDEHARKIFSDTQASDLEGRAIAEQLASEAIKAVAIANKVERQASGLRSYWTATVTDYGAFLAYIRGADPLGLREILDGYAEKQKNSGARMLPGVLIKEDRRAV